MVKVIQRTAFVLAMLAGVVGAARAIDQAMPKDHAANPHGAMNIPQEPEEGTGNLPTGMDRAVFEKQVELDAFRLLAVQHFDQVKIMDSWARQSLSKMRNRQSIDGQDPLYTALDMAFRPEAWADKNIIYVQAVPLRQQLAHLAEGDTEGARQEESRRIMEQGLVSPRFLARTDVQRFLEQQSLDMTKASSVNKVRNALEAFLTLPETLAMVPPAESDRMGPWHRPLELQGNIPRNAEDAKMLGLQDFKPVQGYTNQQAGLIVVAFEQLAIGWQGSDPRMANDAIGSMVKILPAVDPGVYPSPGKRETELWYNRTFYGTVANVFLYFIAMTLFLLVAVGVSDKLRPYAYAVFTVAVILHLASMGIRMWLAGRWPTQNEFESVLAAALLGCVAGWILETWKKNGLFGMAFSFVGFLAMTACMAAPYMFGNDLGGAISKTAGILQTYWLYIHVNIVISSYALISATFILGSVYLLVRLWYWINPLEAEGGGGGGGLEPALAGGMVQGRIGLSAAGVKQIEMQRETMLATLDQANMVILQMAFWFLGIGIVCGAVWADHSWGRPWGWDPKETFALVTWIVYLIIVHLRLVVPKVKADVTAWMSIAGFGIMLFNWIGVNYFLAGLHSYA